MDKKDWIAVIALLLSSFNLIWNIKREREKKESEQEDRHIELAKKHYESFRTIIGIKFALLGTHARLRELHEAIDSLPPGQRKDNWRATIRACEEKNLEALAAITETIPKDLNPGLVTPPVSLDARVSMEKISTLAMTMKAVLEFQITTIDHVERRMRET